MKITSAHIYLDQNIPVQSGNRFMTLRLGVGLTGDVDLSNYEAGYRELHVKAEQALSALVEDARTQAQARLESIEDQAAARRREEQELVG